MNEPPDSDLSQALALIEQIWLKGPPLPTELPGTDDEREQLHCLLEDMANSQRLALALSRGDISHRLQAKGLTAGCLKSLQANLRHLTWQTQMIAGGDLSQQVDFMGEFADAFNSMVRSLDEARARLQRRDVELSQTNRALEAQIFERRAAEEQLRLANESLKTRIAEIEHLQQQLREQAIRDPLTNLFNRRYLQETLERELDHSARAGLSLTVILLDIDFFKRLNDRYGHKAGDLMLVHVAAALERESRRSDIACRFGGEEFVVVLPGAALKDGLRRAEELRVSVQSTRVPYLEFELRATLSLGVAAYPAHGDTGDELLQAADAALYVAKGEGRNCVRAAQTHPTTPT